MKGLYPENTEVKAVSSGNYIIRYGKTGTGNGFFNGRREAVRKSLPILGGRASFEIGKKIRKNANLAKEGRFCGASGNSEAMSSGNSIRDENRETNSRWVYFSLLETYNQ
jgi:hypothetical protein